MRQMTEKMMEHSSSIARAWLISGAPSNWSRILRSGTWLSSSRLQDGLRVWMTREIRNQPLMRQIIQPTSPSIDEQAETEGRCQIPRCPKVKMVPRNALLDWFLAIALESYNMGPAPPK